ncbi:MAG: antitoxin YezG family protein [Bacteroidales bacterium]|nr:antitoxin YezG family protein [Lachnoclostridium sp.]MCM1385427.1 antitoxin YezG family protein [Lachnoclostridium sp.]MCM1464091.1 antitoxin YezG family protein [Bacteroidales bacterium]
MMNEETLTKYYTAIAQKLDEVIPFEWEKVVLYANQTEYSSMALFYFYTEDGNYHYCENIWDKYGVNEREYNKLMNDLDKINESLWHAFKDAGEEPWYSFTFTLDKDWKFNVKYSYENNEGLSGMEIKIRWAYDELGILPPGAYGKELLKKYLLKQERELPEELKDI